MKENKKENLNGDKANVISRLFLAFKKWKLQNRYYELDMDMQCSTMTFKEYCEEKALLDLESKELNGL